jgi:hypothetical protein
MKVFSPKNNFSLQEFEATKNSLSRVVSAASRLLIFLFFYVKAQCSSVNFHVRFDHPDDVIRELQFAFEAIA